MADELDSIVKGAPIASGDVDLSKAVGSASPLLSSADATNGSSGAKKGSGDPLSITPSSPSMIYLNLLILEASLRAQYLDLRARRRHHTFFLTLLSLWVTGFGYALFLAPREDGQGVGGSVYWVVEVTEKVAFMGGIITAVLVWGTGIWERGVRWPRRWLGVSNRGLRGFNCKLVVIKRPWWHEALATAGWFLTYGLFSNTGGSSYRYVEPGILREVDKELNLASQGHPALPILGEDEERGSGHGHEEDLAPGGDYVKLLLLPKPFSPTFRENWELYRTEYWERENERRALIRAKLKERDKQLMRQYGGWFWWLPSRRRRRAAALLAERHHAAQRGEGEKPLHPQHLRHSAVVGEHKRTRSNSVRRGSISTATSSRSPTPTAELEDVIAASTVSRNPSTASNASDKRRKKIASTTGSTRKRPGLDSRSVTPDIPSPLATKRSLSSVASEASAASEAASAAKQSRKPSRSGSTTSAKDRPSSRDTHVG